MRLGLRLVALAGLPLALGFAPAPAQEGRDPGSTPGREPALLDSLRLEARVEAGSTDVVVGLTYALTVPPGVRELPVGGILLGDTRLADDRARTPDGPARLVFDHGIGRRVEGSVLLPQADPGNGKVELEVRYRVVGAIEDAGRERVVTLPVLRVGDGVGEALPGVFRARVVTPPDLHVYESFPTGHRREASGGEEALTLALQVVPSVVTLRARRGDRGPLLPPLRLLDMGVLVLLGGLGAVGLRALIREARP